MSGERGCFFKDGRRRIGKLDTDQYFVIWKVKDTPEFCHKNLFMLCTHSSDFATLVKQYNMYGLAELFWLLVSAIGVPCQSMRKRSNQGLDKEQTSTN